jgi:lipid-binding SYLF domain-containing protein
VIVVLSLKKAAFVFGGEYGSGLMSCRHNAQWSAPVFMQVGKGSWGLQIGAQSIDLVLLVMNVRGGKSVSPRDVVLGNTVQPPDATRAFMDALHRDAR